MSRIRFRALLVLAQLLTLLVLVVILWPDSKTHLRILDFPYLATGYRAKEYCSCLYVLLQPRDFCQQWTQEISLDADLRVDDAQRQVTASFTWLHIPMFESQARWISENQGCLLIRS
jgi:hypothetical protein